MLIKEFRVTLPLTVEEYQVGQLYSVAEASKNETGGGEGIEVLVNEPFDNIPLLGGKFNKGQYTKKIYHLQSKVPSLIKMIAPRGSLEIHEEAWNAYPYCKTVITNPNYMKEKFLLVVESLHLPDRGDQANNPGYMKENFFITIESYHIADAGQLENVHELAADKLKLREVVRIDIGNDPVSAHDYRESEDPAQFTSEKTGRGPLRGDWIEKYAEEGLISTSYKLVWGLFSWRGIQHRMESYIMDFERRLFLSFHRQVFCWIDRWHGLTMEDIRKIEEETKKELDRQRLQGEVRGMRAE